MLFDRRSSSVSENLKNMTADLYLFLAILKIIFPVQGEDASGTTNVSAPEYPITTDCDDFTRRIIIDTDAGSDDAVAILNILGAEELFGNVKVQLITAVAGNTHVDNVGRNILKILKTARRLDIPVYKGSNESILVTPKIEDFFGSDGFGDFDFPDSPSEELIPKKHAVDALIELASVYSGQIGLVCLGPLTNIALATRLDPNFLGYFKEIFILGGSDSGVGNVKPGVEFNFYVDPEAAFIVLKEAEKRKIIINLISWETASLRNVISMDWRKNVLGAVKSPQVELINNAERLNLNGENWVSADTVLSSVVIDYDIVESLSDYHIDVETCGRISRAAIFIDYEPSENLTTNVRLIKKINVDRFKKMLLQNFDLQNGHTNGASKTF